MYIKAASDKNGYQIYGVGALECWFELLVFESFV